MTFLSILILFFIYAAFKILQAGMKVESFLTQMNHDLDEEMKDHV